MDMPEGYDDYRVEMHAAWLRLFDAIKAIEDVETKVRVLRAMEAYLEVMKVGIALTLR